MLDHNGAQGVTERSMFDKMGLSGIPFQVRIRPSDQSYLHIRDDGTIEVLQSGGLETAECE